MVNKKLIIGMAIILILALMLIFNYAASVKEKSSGRFEVIDKQYVDDISMVVIHDNVNNVTCYRYLTGLSCIPDDQIKQRK